MAIAISDFIVPKHLWEAPILQENDKVLVINEGL
jgi:hypothetical protein